MHTRISISFSRLIMALFAVGMIVTAVALFWITYLGSLSIAEHEVARTAKSQAAIVRLVVDQYFDQLETQIRRIASNPEIREAIERNDMDAAMRIADQAAQGLNNAILDILLIDLPDHPGWVNTSLGLIDIRKQIPQKVRDALPPDLWVAYTNHDIEPEFMSAALAVPVFHPETNIVIAKIVGGVSITDSYVLTGRIAETLNILNLGLFHEDEIVAGLGDITSQILPDIRPQELGEVTSSLLGDTLYIALPLTRDFDGHLLNAVVKLPVDTMQKVENTYTRLFTPFVIYTILLALALAIFIKWIAAADITRLLAYANGFSRDMKPGSPPSGYILEFNQLAIKFREAFEIARDKDTQFWTLIEEAQHGILVHAHRRILYVNPAALQILGYDRDQASTLVNASYLILYAPDEHKRMLRFYETELGELADASNTEIVKGIKKDGSTVRLAQIVRPINWVGEHAFYATISQADESQPISNVT